MNRADCIKRAVEMFNSPDFQAGIFAEIERLTKSGALDLESEPDESYGLPKVVLTVALENRAHDYAPLHGGYKKDLRNLRRF